MNMSWSQEDDVRTWRETSAPIDTGKFAVAQIGKQRGVLGGSLLSPTTPAATPMTGWNTVTPRYPSPVPEIGFGRKDNVKRPHPKIADHSGSNLEFRCNYKERQSRTSQSVSRLYTERDYWRPTPTRGMPSNAPSMSKLQMGVERQISMHDKTKSNHGMFAPQSASGLRNQPESPRRANSPAKWGGGFLGSMPHAAGSVKLALMMHKTSKGKGQHQQPDTGDSAKGEQESTSGKSGSGPELPRPQTFFGENAITSTFFVPAPLRARTARLQNSDPDRGDAHGTSSYDVFELHKDSILGSKNNPFDLLRLRRPPTVFQGVGTPRNPHPSTLDFPYSIIASSLRRPKIKGLTERGKSFGGERASGEGFMSARGTSSDPAVGGGLALAGNGDAFRSWSAAVMNAKDGVDLGGGYRVVFAPGGAGSAGQTTVVPAHIQESHKEQEQAQKEEFGGGGGLVENNEQAVGNEELCHRGQHHRPHQASAKEVEDVSNGVEEQEV